MKLTFHFTTTASPPKYPSKLAIVLAIPYCTSSLSNSSNTSCMFVHKSLSQPSSISSLCRSNALSVESAASYGTSLPDVIFSIISSYT